jgi:hypothetical protein
MGQNLVTAIAAGRKNRDIQAPINGAPPAGTRF